MTIEILEILLKECGFDIIETEQQAENLRKLNECHNCRKAKG